MKQLIGIIALLISCTILVGQVQMGNDIAGGFSLDYIGAQVTISSNGTRVYVGAKDLSDPFLSQHGYVKAYTTGWNQTGTDILYTPQESIDVSADGRRVIIGYPREGVGYEWDGVVRVFDQLNGWTQVGNNITGIDMNYMNDNFGNSVSISADGKRIVSGSPGLATGQVRVFDEINGQWVQVGSDINGGSNMHPEFGKKIELSYNGNRMAVGSNGRVELFEEFNGQWFKIGNEILGFSSGDGTGSSLTISEDGKRIAVGSHLFGEGKVRTYEEIGGVWTQLGSELTGSTLGDEFGYAVSISGNGKYLAVGAPGVGNDAGAVEIFYEISGDWIKVGNNIPGSLESWAGYSVAISNDASSLIVGYPNDRGPWSPCWSCGRAKVFDLTGITKGLTGQIYRDFNLNCNKDSLEKGIGNQQITINPGNIQLTTGATGYWSVQGLAAGSYTITVDSVPNMNTNCPLTQTFTITDPNIITFAPDFGFITNDPCPQPNVSIFMAAMRPCFTDQPIYVHAANTTTGSVAIINPYVIVTLDPLIIPTSFEIPPVALGNNQYQFSLPDLLPGQSTSFWIKATVDCQAQLGQGLCVGAELLPVEECSLDTIPNPYPPQHTPCNTQWDGSSLTLIGYCQNDSVFFEITNIADIGNDMTCYSPVYLYVDGALYLQDSVMLNAQQTAVFAFPANGESWHMEVFQHPLHPGNSFPKATVENCGGQTGQTKINLFAHNDADHHIDIYCGEVTGSFDPNDKTGYPYGLTSDHLIPANQQIEYRIRFQNTGTDTAFTVRIRDTLSFHLDPTSVRPGVASHNYSFHVIDNHILEWVFPNIMLPDSNINEPESHGFVWFTVDQMPNLQDGTLLENSAGIYFDFNAPVITNTYKHMIGEPQIILNNDQPETITTSTIKLFPNPTEGMTTIDLNQIYKQVNISITDVSGKTIQQNTMYNIDQHTLTLDTPDGIYFINIETETGLKETLKLVKVKP